MIPYASPSCLALGVYFLVSLLSLQLDPAEAVKMPEFEKLDENYPSMKKAPLGCSGSGLLRCHSPLLSMPPSVRVHLPQAKRLG